MFIRHWRTGLRHRPRLKNRPRAQTKPVAQRGTSVLFASPQTAAASPPFYPVNAVRSQWKAAGSCSGGHRPTQTQIQRRLVHCTAATCIDMAEYCGDCEPVLYMQSRGVLLWDGSRHLAANSNQRKHRAAGGYRLTDQSTQRTVSPRLCRINWKHRRVDYRSICWVTLGLCSGHLIVLTAFLTPRGMRFNNFITVTPVKECSRTAVFSLSMCLGPSSHN